MLLEHADLQNQFLELVWRGAQIDHANNEHDDFAAAVARLMNALQVSTINESFWSASAEQQACGTAMALDGTGLTGEAIVGYPPVDLIRAFCGSILYIPCRVDD